MQSNTRFHSLENGIPINVLEAVKVALAKFPRIRNPIYRARMFNRSSSARAIAPKVYYKEAIAYEHPKVKAERTRRELLDAGMTVYGLHKSETRYLPKILHDNEHIEAVIYGQHESSLAMLIATNERIIYLDKKPIASMFDEVSYDVISGIEFDIHLFFASVVLHTPVKNYDFKFVNMHCAEKFARHIEKHRLERELPGEEHVVDVLTLQPEAREHKPTKQIKDMAGYYWLPTEDEERQKLTGVNI